jgi:eukaryotic-like serine/threonine-protein kinase
MPTAGECIAGRYRLECPLGEGGMGSVWRARHLELDAPIAVKFQHAHKARSKGAAARFRKEARAAARLKSANVVRVVDFGIDGDVQYLAMELLEGESLRTRLERQTLCSVAEVLELTRQAASALDAAHEAGIVHRDFKPSNLFLVQSGGRETVKLLDFGIAKWFESGASAEGLTEDNLVVGSAHYMSPEQARGDAVDPRSDGWSLAVVAYQMLTGLLPFQGGNIPDTLQRICAGNFEIPSRVLSDAYAPFDAVFARAFELDPELRFDSALEFSTALARAGQHLTGVSTPLPSPATSAGGWSFGRDGATRSVPLGRGRRASRRVRRRLGFAAAALLGFVLALAVILPATRSATPTVAAPPSVPGTPRAAVPLATTTSAAEVTSSSPGADRSGPNLIKPSKGEPVRPKRRLPPSASRADHVSPGVGASAAAPPPSVPQLDPLPAPDTTARAPAATHVDPVFGLEVPARR